jgi:hypothetical protein
MSELLENVAVGEEAEREVMSDSGHKLSDLGDEALHHWHLYNCSLDAPGDWAEEEVEDVNCPECLAHFERLKQRRAKARG